MVGNLRCSRENPGSNLGYGAFTKDLNLVIVKRRCYYYLIYIWFDQDEVTLLREVYILTGTKTRQILLGMFVKLNSLKSCFVLLERE